MLIFLDEYDTPLQEAFVNDYWDEMSGFMRGLFNSTFKTNPALLRAVMTGITRVSKESIFSELNNPNVVTTTSTQYETAFGFSEDEVSAALDEYGLTSQAENVRRWYDGFTFGNTSDIYNPWSIINYLKQRRLSPYWANTSSNSLISYELRRSDIITKDQMLELMNGYTIHTRLDDQIIFSQLDDNAEALWSLFLASGYLKVVHTQYLEPDEWYDLTITNLEVSIMFRDLITLWFNDVRVAYSEFMQALIKGSASDVEECLQDVLIHKTGFFDTKKNQSDNRKPESFYHGLVLHMVAQEPNYHIESNSESGLGRYDVMMMPKVQRMSPKRKRNTFFSDTLQENKKLPAILIEFKIFDAKKENSLAQTAKRALNQIEERHYDAKLRDMGFKEDQILKYGFGFSGKRLAVQMKSCKK